MKRLWLLVLVYLFSSCGDFLEPKSKNEYVPKNVAALNEMLIGSAYPKNDGGLNYGLFLLDDDVTSNPEVGVYGIEAQGIEGARYVFSWQPDMFEKLQDAGSNMFFNIWGRHYELILGANAALDYIDAMDGTEDEKNVVKAQAYALRGFLYFNLVNIFGEPYNDNKKALGVPLKLNSGVENKLLPRKTVEEVYEQVLADLGEAERCYLAMPKEMQFQKGYRTSLPMVQLIKSRMYLYMENWKEAAVYADRVIKDWDLSLIDFNAIVKPAGSEYYRFISIDCPENIWMFGSGRDFRYSSFFPSTPGEGSKRFFIVSPELLDGFKSGDLRRKEYIVVYSKVNNVPYNKSVTGGTMHSDYFGQGLRLPEAYLNLAEAAAMDEDETTALWALNTLREKRFTVEDYRKITDLSGQALIDTIRQERRLEMCFELHRWFDLRRYGMPSITRDWNVGGGVIHKYTLEEKDKAYTLPIPLMVLDENKLLIQNDLASPRMPIK